MKVVQRRYGIIDWIKRLARRKGAAVALCVFIAVVLVAIFAPFIAPYDPKQLDPVIRLKPPGAELALMRYGI